MMSTRERDRTACLGCDACRETKQDEEKLPPDYSPAWDYHPTRWEAEKGSWLRPPAYGAYTVDRLYPDWSTALHSRGLVLPSSVLAEYFREGMYPFYVHMILLNEYSRPPFPLYTAAQAPGGSVIVYKPHPQKKGATYTNGSRPIC